MKIKQFISSLLFVAVALGAFSCIEDEGNYTYKETNIVGFEGLVGLDVNNPYEINLGEPTTIKPEMTQTLPTDEDDYTYLWLRVGTRQPATERIHFDTVHVGKYMEDFSVPLTPRATAYKMVYQAKNNVTGVTYSSDYFYFKIIGDITTGYLILHEVDEKPVLKFHNYKGSRFEERTVDLSSLGDDLGKPINIVTYPDSNSPTINASNGYSVSLLTESGLYRLKHDDFSYEDNYNIKYFIFGDEPADFRIQQIYATLFKGTAQAMIKDQNGDYMYYNIPTGNYTSIPWTYGVICNAYQVSGVKTRFTPGAFVFGNGGSAFFYDEDSRSIVGKAEASNFCTKFSPSLESMFPLNDVNYTPIHLFYQYLTQPSNPRRMSLYILAKMDTGGYKLMAFSTGTSTPWLNTDFNVTDIENAKYYSTSYASSGPNYNLYGMLFYYATDKKVYCRDINNNITREVYSAPAGNVISAIKVEVHAGTGTAAACPFGDHLIVTTNSETGADTSTFEIFSITPLTGLLTIAKDIDGNELRWTDMPKIVGVDWKNK